MFENISPLKYLNMVIFLNKHTSPNASVHPTIPPEALAISPWNINSEFRNMLRSLAPLYEWILDLL